MLIHAKKGSLLSSFKTDSTAVVNFTTINSRDKSLSTCEIEINHDWEMNRVTLRAHAPSCLNPTPIARQEPCFSHGSTEHFEIDAARSLWRTILERFHHSGKNIR